MATTADFSVGDTVKVITTHANYGWGCINTGDIGMISCIANAYVRIDFPKHKGWMAGPDEIEAIEITGQELYKVLGYELFKEPKKVSPKKPDSRHVI